MKLLIFILSIPILTSAYTINHIESMAGCYTIDYTYSEIDALAKDYGLDPRMYDTSSVKFNVKELIKVVRKSNQEIRLQHFMFATDKATGKEVFRLRHHGEIWKYKPNFAYQYMGLDKYTPVTVKEDWLRIITSLDDGLRYHCPGTWTKGEYPKFTCKALSPIPGRETRDMGRKDYNTSLRNSEVTIYPNAWFERQDNEKILLTNNGEKKLAREIGKHWYTKLPMQECSDINTWANERQNFWNLLETIWTQHLDGSKTLVHKKVAADGTIRSKRIAKIREHHFADLNKNPIDPKILKHIKDELNEIISKTITY